MDSVTTSTPQRPRDAATVIIVDGGSSDPRILMGRRRHDQVFMPGKYVFPGGRVDPGDKGVASADELDGGEVEKLLYDMKGHASAVRARSIAIAGIREVFEETGLIIGKPLESNAKPCEHEALVLAETWKPYFEQGYM
ncbi:MAG: hypothetical protein ACR2PG_26685, partial [Hyphomicrobiaceae bacterium]